MQTPPFTETSSAAFWLSPCMPKRQMKIILLNSDILNEKLQPQIRKLQKPQALVHRNSYTAIPEYYPQSPQPPPPSNKKKNPKTLNLRESPRVNLTSPKVNVMPSHGATYWRQTHPVTLGFHRRGTISRSTILSGNAEVAAGEPLTRVIMGPAVSCGCLRGTVALKLRSQGKCRMVKCTSEQLAL